MAEDDMRDEIAQALAAIAPLRCGPYALADALLHVVDRIAREAAGKALREAADAERATGGWAAAERLRARAEAAERGEG